MTRNTIMLGVVMILCAGSLIWLEGRFTSSDHRKAKRLVAGYSVDHRDETFEAFIVRKHGGVLGQWDSEVLQSCRGVARVTWTLHGDPPTVYAWDVDIPTQEIFAVVESPGGKRLLEEFNAAADELPPLELPEPSGAEAAP